MLNLLNSIILLHSGASLFQACSGISKWDNLITKWDQKYLKVEQVIYLEVGEVATAKRKRYYKIGQLYYKVGRDYNLGQL